ncbi:hypothetical protein [Sediminibacterium goheungense]|uniref:Glycosyltransferase family 1 protein n=1 Tax=Sediminibacterium goheungense TaxID=1086393 RepID=A0A4R6ITL1_9BACT|nr:hypothetical protein [Sediminibacterium goheungense]TDO25872.1 hypothetical protein BC659_2796 [Sediminibacterium goheungense]
MSLLKNIVHNWKLDYNHRQKEKRFTDGIRHLPQVLTPLLPITGDTVHFKHTGHAGDVIYSIPAMKALAKGRKINLYFELHQPNRDFTKQMKHPNGNVMLNEKSVSMFAPLIAQQPDFHFFGAWNGEAIHYDLTAFRAFPFDYRMYSIARWYFLTFAVTADLGAPWLQIQPDLRFSDKIVLARSSRYHTPGISYSFLSKYANLVFVGVPDEYEAMKKELPHLVYQPVSNFAELAAIIAGSKFFIGNQSFPFSLAEALKVPRILEVYYQCPNVIPEGPGAYDFCYQLQFEKIVSDLHNRM